MKKKVLVFIVFILLILFLSSSLVSSSCDRTLKTVGDDRKTLTVGETWNLGSGYYLVANSINAKSTPRQAEISLFKDDIKVDDEVIFPNTTYEYEKHSYCGMNDVIILTIFIDSIFNSATTDMMQLKNLSFIGEEIVSCVSRWQCSAWSSCVEKYQTRTCIDINYCRTETNKPAEKQLCAPCTENWICTNWNNCDGGLQKRNCNDSNNCSTETNKPIEKQNCSISNVPCTENWNCDDWISCVNGQKTRTCKDTNNCNTTVNKPALTKNCSVQNQGQEEIEVLGEEQIEINIQNKRIIIEKNSEGINIIKMDDKNVETSLELFKELGKLYIKTSTGKIMEIKILFKDAVSKAEKVENVESVKIDEYNKIAVYSISGTKKVRLLFIFPVLMKVEQKINVETGEIVFIKMPWWSFLASGV